MIGSGDYGKGKKTTRKEHRKEEERIGMTEMLKEKRMARKEQREGGKWQGRKDRRQIGWEGGKET